MAVSELEASPILTLTDIQRALRRRARRMVQLAQAITLLRLEGWSPERIREQLGVDEGWFTRAEGLVFEARVSVIEELGLDGLFDEDRARAIEGPIGRVVIRLGEIMKKRVDHAEQIMFLRSEGYTTENEIRSRSGMDADSYRVALRWLKDAGMTIKEEEE